MDNSSNIALEQLYTQHRRELQSYVYKAFGSGPPEPDDIIQSTFERCASINWRQVGNPRAFLHRVAHNIAVSQYRRQKVQSHFILDASIEPSSAEIDYEFDAERVVLATESYAKLREAMMALPPKRRRMILMSRIEGLSLAEIGRRTGMSAPGVRKHIAKGLVALQDALDHDE